MLFHEKQDIRLLRLVRAHPVLYDYNDPHYMDANAREVIWQKIGDELKRPASACKIRYINIRDVYRRILKKNSEAGPHTRPKVYKYDSEVSFLRRYFKEVVTSNVNFDSFDDADDRLEESLTKEEDQVFNSEPEYIETDVEELPEPKPQIKRSSKSSVKKKKIKLNFTEVEDPISTSAFNESAIPTEFDSSDPVDAFLLSIGATLKTFSPYHLNVAKSKIFAIVQEHDLQQIVQKEQSNDSDIKIGSSDTMYIH
ncbi:uncharacterized protein LOC121736339 [Aricia agestis]|uniref:uncharacterized protein LOC121736339 n=1 Tax=Aricia agestis TaxID=91739 RepID=UPI001C202543|nr:uncharacterized protein LOC121736339 [Aricia agestis]